MRFRSFFVALLLCITFAATPRKKRPPTPDITQLSMKGEREPGTLWLGKLRDRHVSRRRPVVDVDAAHVFGDFDVQGLPAVAQDTVANGFATYAAVVGVIAVDPSGASVRIQGGAPFLHRHNKHITRVKPLYLVAQLVLVISLLGAATPAYAASRAMNSCRFGPEFTPAVVIHEIRCANYWVGPVPMRTVMCIANRESHFYARALNPYSAAGGVFQALPSTWTAWQDRSPDFKRWFGIGADVMNARNNVMLSLRVMHNEGLSPWAGPGC